MCKRCLGRGLNACEIWWLTAQLGSLFPLSTSECALQWDSRHCTMAAKFGIGHPVSMEVCLHASALELKNEGIKGFSLFLHLFFLSLFLSFWISFTTGVDAMVQWLPNLVLIPRFRWNLFPWCYSKFEDWRAKRVLSLAPRFIRNRCSEKRWPPIWHWRVFENSAYHFLLPNEKKTQGVHTRVQWLPLELIPFGFILSWNIGWNVQRPRLCLRKSLKFKIQVTVVMEAKRAIIPGKVTTMKRFVSVATLQRQSGNTIVSSVAKIRREWLAFWFVSIATTVCRVSKD